jgi:hypothetical protein
MQINVTRRATSFIWPEEIGDIMNDDAWTVLLTMIRSWWVGMGTVNPCPSEPAAGLLVVRKPLLVNGRSSDAGPPHGPRHFVDRPPGARQAARGAARDCGPRKNGAPRRADCCSRRLPQGHAIRPRRTRRLGALIQRFVALRNRRMGPRFSGLQARLPQRTTAPSSSRAHAALGRCFADLCPDGEAANADPP